MVNQEKAAWSNELNDAHLRRIQDPKAPRVDMDGPSTWSEKENDAHLNRILQPARGFITREQLLKMS